MSGSLFRDSPHAHPRATRHADFAGPDAAHETIADLVERARYANQRAGLATREVVPASIRAPGRLLALDLSTNVGWAVMERGRTPEFGTERLPGPDAGIGVIARQGRRYACLLDWLSTMRSRHGFEALAWERPILPHYPGQLATTLETMALLWGLAAMAQLFAWRGGLRGIACPVDQAKIALTGSRFAKKADMVRAAWTVMDWPVANDHEADAGAVGLWAYEQLYPAGGPEVGP